jgi:hypothetical protein
VSHTLKYLMQRKTKPRPSPFDSSGIVNFAEQSYWL